MCAVPKRLCPSIVARLLGVGLSQPEHQTTCMPYSLPKSLCITNANPCLSLPFALPLVTEHAESTLHGYHKEQSAAMSVDVCLTLGYCQLQAPTTATSKLVWATMHSPCTLCRPKLH